MELIIFILVLFSSKEALSSLFDFSLFENVVLHQEDINGIAILAQKV